MEMARGEESSQWEDYLSKGVIVSTLNMERETRFASPFLMAVDKNTDWPCPLCARVVKEVSCGGIRNGCNIVLWFILQE